MNTMRRLLASSLVIAIAGTACVPVTARPAFEPHVVTADAAARPQTESSNAEDVRRIAQALGTGRHVAVKLTSGTTLRGHLQSIDEDYFVLLPDRNRVPMTIAYADVQKLGPNLSRLAKIAIYGGIIAVGVFCLAPYPIGFLCKSDPS